MDFPPDHYLETAMERIAQAQFLYRRGDSYALAIYVGGLAVECLLRAFKGRRDPTFDERHDLLRLLAGSGLLLADRAKLERKGWTDDQIDAHLQELRVAANEIIPLWANNYRFASENRLLVHLKKITGYRRIKGNYLKEQARRFLNAAQRFIDKGVVQWPI